MRVASLQEDAEEPQVRPPQIDVEAGLGGVARPGHWTPVAVELSAPGRDFVGELVLRTVHLGIPYETRSACSVLAGRNVRRTLSFPADDGTIQSLKLEAVASEGPSSDVVTAQVQLLEARRGLLLVLNHQLPDGEKFAIRNVSVKAAALPTHWESYLPADALLWIPDRSLPTPSPAATRAVLDWVHAGGTLILSVGGNAHDCAGTDLEALLPGRPEKMVHLEDARGFEDLAQTQSPVSFDAQTFRRGIADESQVLLTGNDTPILYHRALGAGSVFVLPFDLRNSRWIAWSGTLPLLRQLVQAGRRSTMGFRSDPLRDFPFAQAVEERFDRRIEGLLEGFDFYLPIRSTGILLLFGSYALLVGPIEFFLLRRSRRTLWTLWTTPLIVAVVTLLLLGKVWGRQAQVITTHELNFVDLEPSTGSAARTTLASFYFPTGGREHVTAALPNTLLRPLPTEQVLLGAGDVVLHQDLTGSAMELSVYAHSVRTLAAQWRGAKEACLDLELRREGDDLRLVNRSGRPLEGLCWIRHDPPWLALGDLGAGGSLLLDPKLYPPVDPGAHAPSGDAKPSGQPTRTASDFEQVLPSVAIDLLTQGFADPDRRGSPLSIQQQPILRALKLPRRLRRECVVGRVLEDGPVLSVADTKVDRHAQSYFRIPLP